MLMLSIPAIATVVAPMMAPLVDGLSLQSGKSCPADSPLSCHVKGDADVDACCVNYPGGSLLQAQFWDYKPAQGPNDSWTIHGLCYDQFCDNGRKYNNISAILDSFGEDELIGSMSKYWKDQNGKDETLWEHEWNKHGTCVSTMDPDCYAEYQPQQEVVDYFRRTVDLFHGLDSYKAGHATPDCDDAGIVPSDDATYDLQDIQDALSDAFGAVPAARCRGSTLNELWYFFNVRGSAQSGQYVPTSPDGSKSNCPASGIRYPPKRQERGGDPHKPANPGSGEPFQGKGYLRASLNGRQTGCLITGGRWYVSGACGTYTATPNGDATGFTLRTRKGPCGILKGAFTCGGGAREHEFQDENGTMTLYANSIPHGTQQVPLYLDDSDAQHTLEVTWQSK
ncbi:ribonuclease T2-like [Ascosphaera acerosa]|nr:ribonuclease T2-like [Ascosphaera acerosa]